MSCNRHALEPHPEEELQLSLDWDSMEAEVGEYDSIESQTFSKACSLDHEECEACQ